MKVNLRNYWGVILGSIILLPIYHIPVFLVTIMFITGIIQDFRNPLYMQLIIIILGIIIEFIINSIPNIAMNKVIFKNRIREEREGKYLLGESIIVVLMIIGYLVIFVSPLIS